MSSSYEYSYQLEAERRRQIYLNRIAATTEEFYRRYEQQYREMLSHGLLAYIPSEMSRLESDLARIRDLLVSDPESARDISFDIGSYIRTMSSLASAAREEFERSERMRVTALRTEREQQQSELMNEYFKILQTITNPIVVNYSISKMQELRTDIENGKLSSSTELKEISTSIISEAEKKASDWKENTVKKHHQKNVAQAINEAESRLKSEKIENQEKTQEFLNKINKLRSALESGAIDSNTIEKKVVELENEVDETLISEETRREIVISIIKQLQKQGFWVMGAHMEGDRTLYEADMTIPTVIVIGNEGKGLSRVVKEACDFLVTIPMYGNLNSLNASVAAAVLMYEAVRQRQAK